MAHWKHGRSKPVIGLVGGIGAGKSRVARLLAGEGCAVIDSDALAHEALNVPQIRAELQGWLGDDIVRADGSVDRKKIAARVFGDPEKTRRLNGLIHPEVARQRDSVMQRVMADGSVRAVVWDSPLLMEAGLDRECDAILFVKINRDIQLKRVQENRGWTPEELERREKLQFPLDKKARVADYCVDNSGDDAATLCQVQRVLSHLFATPRSLADDLRRNT